MFSVVTKSVMDMAAESLIDLPTQALISDFPLVGKGTTPTGNFIFYSFASLYLGTMFGGLLSALSVFFYIPVFLFVLYEIYLNYSLVAAFEVTDATNYPNTYYYSNYYTYILLWWVWFLLTMPIQFVMGLLFSIP